MFNIFSYLFFMSTSVPWDDSRGYLREMGILQKESCFKATDYKNWLVIFTFLAFANSPRATMCWFLSKRIEFSNIKSYQFLLELINPPKTEVLLNTNLSQYLFDRWKCLNTNIWVRYLSLKFLYIYYSFFVSFCKLKLVIRAPIINKYFLLSIRHSNQVPFSLKLIKKILFHSITRTIGSAVNNCIIKLLQNSSNSFASILFTFTNILQNLYLSVISKRTPFSWIRLFWR